MTSVLSEIVEILYGGITNVASAIGEGLSELVKQIFLDGSGTTEDPYTLSVFGGVICIFAGIALCVGLSKFVVNFLTGFGR